jgi:predicted Zn finger-like uncharacterized protein
VFVTCGNCDAEYELDEAKIPAGGARLRCTNCDHSFVVRPPEASDLQSADDLARDALSAERRSEAAPDSGAEKAPTEAFDFNEEMVDDPAFEAAMDEGFDVGTEAAPDPQVDTAPDEDFEVEVDIDADIDLEGAADSDFEAMSEGGFDLNADADSNPDLDTESGDDLEVDVDFAVEADGASDFEAAPDAGSEPDGEANADSDFEVASDEGFDLEGRGDPDSDFEVASDEGLDLEGRGDPDPELEGALHATSTEDSDLEVEADWQFNEEVDSAEPVAAAGGAESPFDQGEDWNDLSTAEDVVDDLLGSGASIAADPAEAVDALLGDIDEVDSQLGDSAGESMSDPELPSQQLDLGGSSSAPAEDGFGDLSDWDLFDPAGEGVGAEDSAAAASRAAAGDRAEPRVGIAVAMAGDSRMDVRWTDRALEAAGWLAAGLLVVVALVGGLVWNSSDAQATSGRWSGAGFEADQIVGRWVDNAVAGPIYVVSGRVRRTAGSDRDGRTALGIQLLNATGLAIDRTSIPLAPTVPERILRESSPAEIDDFQRRRAGQIAVVGERWVSFEAVLTDLPQFAGRFELQAIDR